MNKFVFMCISTFLLLLPQALNAAEPALAGPLGAPSLLRTLDDTISEIRAIAKARIHFNEGWVRYIREGKFEIGDSESASEEERAKHYAATFLRNRTISFSQIEDAKIPLFEKDIERYANIVTLIDARSTIANFLDCLYAYLHCLYCLAPVESCSKELRELYWFSSMRGKLNPYVQPSSGYWENLLVKEDNGKYQLSDAFFVKKYNRLNANISEVVSTIEKKVTQNQTHVHSLGCPELFQNAVHSLECGDFLRLSVAPPLNHASFIIDSSRISVSQHRYNSLGESISLFSAAASSIPSLVSSNSYFLKVFQDQLLPLLVKTEQFNLEIERKSRLLKKAEPIIRNYQTDCCDGWRAHKKSIEEAELAERKREMKAFLSRNKKQQQTTKPSKLPATNNEVKLEEKEQTTPHQTEAKVTPTHFIPPQEEATVVEAISVLEKDPEDYLSFEKIQSQENQEEVAEDDKEKIYSERTPRLFSNYKSVHMIFDTRGSVDYAEFTKQLLRDFRGQIYKRARESGNSRLRKLMIPASNGRIASECALYDEPHGSQLEKAWPQWRHAYKDMFIRLAEQWVKLQN